jgi:hypothetical protein
VSAPSRGIQIDIAIVETIADEPQDSHPARANQQYFALKNIASDDSDDSAL